MASENPVEPGHAKATPRRTPRQGPKGAFPGGLAVAALGVVFGDIGTSPLYTLKTCFTTIGAPPTAENAMGIVSLLLWTIVAVVCVKYVTLLMRIDHDGEGGILALLAIAEPPKIFGVSRKVSWLVWVVAIGAAMIIGDGMITPAISVISAIEGLSVATPAAQTAVVPLSVVILIGLFAIQWRGTQRVGVMFGPVMILWFLAIAAAGIVGIANHPTILAAVNPSHALWFVTHHGAGGFLIFGAIILGMTGAEALYADMSHFGRIPITLSWYVFVLPALVLNYMGQAALIVADPKTLDSPFYALAPGPWLLPMVALATAATVIASQSLISGAFTLTEQAIALNLSPRFRVLHTSADQRGQVYVPIVNGIIALACLLLVVTFRSSDRLAAMYGLAVSCTMLATDVVFFVVASRRLHWKPWAVFASTAPFVVLDSVFVLAGLPKFADGAWVPLLVAAIITTVAITWLTGRRSFARSLSEDQEPVKDFLARYRPAAGAPKETIVFLTGDPSGVPFVNDHKWLNPLLAAGRVVLLTIKPVARPYAREADRLKIEQDTDRFARVSYGFGYMERPRIAPIINSCEGQGLRIGADTTSFIYADPVLVRAKRGGLPRWQFKLFEFLQRLSHSLADELEIKANSRVELGIEVPI